MFNEGTFARLETDSPLARTLEGIGIGSTEAEVSEAYGDRIKSTPNVYEPDTTNDLLYVPDKSSETGIQFLARDGIVAYIFAGRLHELKLIEGCL